MTERHWSAPANREPRAIFKFQLEPELRLLTATRTGTWSLTDVRSYEAALRRELVTLHRKGSPNLFIIDIRASGAQPKDVADALRTMVEGLGPLRASKTAIVTASGLAKLEARQMGDPNARTFTSMVLARDWVLSGLVAGGGGMGVHDEPSDAAPEGGLVHIVGPANVDVTLTPEAALETAKRIDDAAVLALRETRASRKPRPKHSIG